MRLFKNNTLSAVLCESNAEWKIKKKTSCLASLFSLQKWDSIELYRMAMFVVKFINI